MGFMYTASILIGVKNCFSVQPVVGVERIVLYRERAAGMYSSMAYAASQASYFLLFCRLNVFFIDLLENTIFIHSN